LRCVWFRLGLYAAVFLGLLVFGGCTMIYMPGESFRGDPPPLTAEQEALRTRLKGHVVKLAGEIGNRQVAEPGTLAQARRYITGQFSGMGYAPKAREYEAGGATVANLEVELPGSEHPERIVIIGAHYDTDGNPGADDNASAVAGLLELARWFHGRHPALTLRFVAFVNEEPPFFQQEGLMGSWVYAREAREAGEDIRAMVSLEMLGCYSEEKGSQHYPFPLSLLYPSTGDFIAFVGNFSNRKLVRKSIRVFRGHATVPSEGAALPGWLTGVGWSDHWSFWQEEYPAFMVTDTAFFRNPHYHQSTDRPDTLNYETMTRVVEGLKYVVEDLTTP